MSNQEKLCNFEVAMQTQLLEVKSCYEDNLIYELSAGNTANIYKYINNIRGSHVIPETLFQDSKALTSDLDKSNMFIQFFYTLFTHSNLELRAANTLDSVFTRSNLELHAANTLSANGPTISCTTISEEDVYLPHHLFTGVIKSHWANGTDPNILKFCALLFTHHLFIQHYLPRDRCVHHITSVYRESYSVIFQEIDVSTTLHLFIESLTALSSKRSMCPPHYIC